VIGNYADKAWLAQPEKHSMRIDALQNSIRLAQSGAAVYHLVRNLCHRCPTGCYLPPQLYGLPSPTYRIDRHPPRFSNEHTD
jgi:hypothetical protein